MGFAVMLAASGSDAADGFPLYAAAVVGLVVIWVAAAGAIAICAVLSHNEDLWFFPFGVAVVVVPILGWWMSGVVLSNRDEAIAAREALPRLEVATNPDAPSGALLVLATDPRDDVRMEVTTNPAATPEVLAVFVEDPDEEIRLSVASNPATAAESLAVLAGDNAEDVRIAVAVNPSTSPIVLDRLAGDHSPIVRACVGSNPNASPETLTRLAGDVNYDVRLAAVANNSAPDDALIEASSIGVNDPPQAPRPEPARRVRRPGGG